MRFCYLSVPAASIASLFLAPSVQPSSTESFEFHRFFSLLALVIPFVLLRLVWCCCRHRYRYRHRRRRHTKINNEKLSAISILLSAI